MVGRLSTAIEKLRGDVSNVKKDIKDLNLSNGAVENNRKHDDLAMGSMGIRPHGQQRIASCIWNMHRMTLEHAWNNAEKTGWI